MPSAAEVIESCLIETTKIGRCNQVTEQIIGHLDAAGFTIVAKEPPPYMNSMAKANYRMNISVGDRDVTLPE